MEHVAAPRAPSWTSVALGLFLGGCVVLYRITRPSPRASLAQIAPVAEVRGFAQEMSWLEDSSAVLVGTDLDPTKTIQNHDPSMQGQRIAILNIDGRVVIAPENAR